MEGVMSEEDFWKLIEGNGESISLNEEQIEAAHEESLMQFEKMEEKNIAARTYSLKAQKEIFITF